MNCAEARSHWYSLRSTNTQIKSKGQGLWARERFHVIQTKVSFYCIVIFIDHAIDQRRILTSLGSRSRVERSVRDVRASAGALATLVRLLLGLVQLDVSWVNGGAKVYGPQGVIGAPPLTDEWRRRCRLLIALIFAFALILRLTLAGGHFLFFGVILIPQPMALEMGNRWKKGNDLQVMLHSHEDNPEEDRQMDFILLDGNICNTCHTISYIIRPQNSQQFKQMEGNLLAGFKLFAAQTDRYKSWLVDISQPVLLKTSSTLTTHTYNQSGEIPFMLHFTYFVLGFLLSVNELLNSHSERKISES